MEYKISVIMPVYNGARFLREAMDSLIHQTIGFENLHIVLIDDWSTDESPKMMAEYAQKYPNIEVYKTEANSGGPGIPRNVGIEHAKAPYLMFLDPDDYYSLDACEKLYDKIKKTGAEIVSGSFCRVDENGENVRDGGLPFPKEETRFDLPEQAIEAFEQCGYVTNKVFDTVFFRKHGFRFPKGYGEDTPVIMACYMKARYVLYMPVCFYYYRSNSLSITSNRTKKYVYGYLPQCHAFEEYLGEYPETWQYIHDFMAKNLCGVIRGKDFERQDLIEICRDCAPMFTRVVNGPEDVKILSILIENGYYEEAADFWLLIQKHDQECRDICCGYESLIKMHENRAIVRLADAINQRRFGDAVKICFAAIKSRLRK